MTIEEFELIKETLPTQAGVYKYIDSKGTILYVGTAKNLKKRISQYFVDNRQTASRIKMMVKLAERIEFTVVSNENDALILENGLIKEFQPKYNIRLKDDKTYPFIAIKKESFPRVFFTRKYIKDGSEYLGPYTSVLFAKEVFNTLKTIFPLRTCNLNLAPEKMLVVFKHYEPTHYNWSFFIIGFITITYGGYLLWRDHLKKEKI
jgi:excinuclease ABC subunit C